MKEYRSQNLEQFQSDLFEAFSRGEKVLQDKSRRNGSTFIWYTDVEAPVIESKEIKEEVVQSVKEENKTPENVSESVVKDKSTTTKKTSNKKTTKKSK